jgi:hypothetical protein
MVAKVNEESWHVPSFKYVCLVPIPGSLAQSVPCLSIPLVWRRVEFKPRNGPSKNLANRIHYGNNVIDFEVGGDHAVEEVGENDSTIRRR